MSIESSTKTEYSSLDLLLDGTEDGLEPILEAHGPQAVDQFVEMHNSLMLAIAGFEHVLLHMTKTNPNIFLVPAHNVSRVDH